MTAPGSIVVISSAGTNTARPGDRRERPGHRRVIVGAEPDDQIVDLAEPKTVGVTELTAHNERQMQYRRTDGRNSHLEEE